MKRDVVAPMRKAKNPIPAAPKKTGIYVKTCRRAQVESQRGIQI